MTGTAVRFAVNPENDVGPTPRGITIFLGEFLNTKTVTGAYGGLWSWALSGLAKPCIAGLSNAHTLIAAHLLVFAEEN